MIRCATHDETFPTTAALHAHIRDVHARPATSGAGDRLLAEWSASVGR